jgi:DNA-binding SARP family transcriptional activator
VEILRAGRRVPLSPKERDLVALLVARGPEPVAPDRIEEELWCGAPPATARKVVQKYVSQLRVSLGTGHIMWSRDGYALRDVSLDARTFARAVESADHGDARQTAAAVQVALALWRGEPYGGVDLVAVEPERARLAELRLLAIHREVEAELALGRHAALVGRLEQLVTEHPLCEGLWSQLIRALYGAGRPSDALRAYGRLKDHLAEELGVDPSPELRALERLVLDHDPSLGPVAAPAHGAQQRRELTVVAVAAADRGEDDPEHRMRTARQRLATVERICTEHGGSVETAIGGRIVVRFGDPALGDDADRAVRAAHRIVDELEHARAGVATGWAIVDPEASPGARVIGAVVDTAWTAAEGAAVGSVVVDPSSTVACTSRRPDLPFVGRADDLAALHGVVRRTLDGHGPQLVSVVGEAGVGKTRLVSELRLRNPAGRWLTVECIPGDGAATPLRLLALDSLLEDVIPDSGDREWVRCAIGPGAIAERSEVVAAWTTLFAAMANRRPTVLVFEDLHQTDASCPAMLSDCVAQLGACPLLIVTTARPTSRPTLGRELALRGLAADEIEGLLVRLLPDDALDVVQRRTLARRSAGNPLYAIQFARMVEQPGWDGSVPATVRSLIAARLDLLAPIETDLIVAAAVLESSFEPDELAEVLDVDSASTAEPLRRLLANGLVERVAGNQLRLCHDLVREVAYERLPRPARARLHQAAAETIERRAGNRLPDFAMRVAHHLGAAASAIEFEGRQASHLRWREFELMVLAGDSLGDRADAESVESPFPADQAELDRVLAESLCRRGELRRAEETAVRGLAAAQAADDLTAQARLHALIGNINWLRGDTTACVGSLESARRLVAGLPPGPPLLDAIANLAFVTALLGRTADAIELGEQGLQLARESDAVEKEVRCLKARGAARLLAGDLAGYSDFTTALARSLERGLSHESAMAYHNLGELNWQARGPAAGLELNGKGLELAQRRGLVVATDWLRANRVSLCFDAGEWDEALALTDVVLSRETAAGEGQAGTMAAVWAARVHVWRGELARAERLRDFFLPRARRHAVTQQVGPALVVAGLVETASGDTARGADLAAEFCALTEHTRQYRHMELADTVRLLLADGRFADAARAADSDVFATARNLCQSATASAALAMVRGDEDARERFAEAADAWHSFGQPLETHLAWRASGWPIADPIGAGLGIDPTVADRLTPTCRPPVPG